MMDQRFSVYLGHDEVMRSHFVPMEFVSFLTHAILLRVIRAERPVFAVDPLVKYASDVSEHSGSSEVPVLQPPHRRLSLRRILPKWGTSPPTCSHFVRPSASTTL